MSDIFSSDNLLLCKLNILFYSSVRYIVLNTIVFAYAQIIKEQKLLMYPSKQLFGVLKSMLKEGRPIRNRRHLFGNLINKTDLLKI